MYVRLCVCVLIVVKSWLPKPKYQYKYSAYELLIPKGSGHRYCCGEDATTDYSSYHKCGQNAQLISRRVYVTPISRRLPSIRFAFSASRAGSGQSCITARTSFLPSKPLQKRNHTTKNKTEQNRNKMKKKKKKIKHDRNGNNTPKIRVFSLAPVFTYYHNES